MSIRPLADAVRRANAALVAYDSGFTHDGNELPGREAVLARALASLDQAQRIRAQLPRHCVGAAPEGERTAR